MDSVFVWLNGKTPSPDFSIDLSSLKTTFAAEAAKAAGAKVAALPLCPAGLPGGADSFDAFNATCLPRGLTPAIVAAQVQNDITSGQGFIKDPSFTADSLKASGSNQSVFADQLKNAPMTYQKVKKAPMVLAILALLTALGIVFLSPSLTRGLRRAGTVFLVVGFVLLAFAWALNYGVNQKLLPNLKLDNKVLQEKVRTLVSDITKSIDKTYWTFGASYAVLGALAIIGPMFIHKQRGTLPADNEALAHEAITDKPEKTNKKSIEIQ